MISSSTNTIRILGLIALPAAAVLLYWGSSSGGAFVFPDSITYWSVAKSLVAGEGIVQFDGKPLIHWPPLYPVVFSLLEMAGWNALQEAARLNAVLVGAMVLMGGLWLWRSTRSYPAALLVTVALLLSQPLWWIAGTALAGTLFAFLVLGSILALQQFLDRQVRGWLLLAILAAALACLTRYVGVFLVLSGALTLLWQGGNTFSRRVGQACAYAAGALFPFALWWIHVTRTAGSGGDRVLSDWSLGEISFEMLRAFSNWGLPWSVPTPQKTFILLLLGAVVLSLLFLLRGSQRATGTKETGRSAALGSFSITYTLGLALLAMVIGFDLPGERLLTPVYAPLVLWSFHLMTTHLMRMKFARRQWVVVSLLSVMVFVWAGRSAIVTSKRVVHQRLWASSLNDARWKQSETLRALQGADSTRPLYSNVPHAIYLHTMRRAQRSPRKLFYATKARKTKDLERFGEMLSSEESVRLAWFFIDQASFLYTPQELAQIFDLRILSRHDDGVIFQVRARKQTSPVDERGPLG